MGNSLKKPGLARSHSGASSRQSSRSKSREEDNCRPSPAAPPSFASLSRCYLEEQLSAIIKHKSEAAAEARPVKFNKLLLQFSALYAGFAKCKDVFRDLDTNGNGKLQLEELRAGCSKLGYHLSSEELERTFAATDKDRDHALDVREFIVVLAILHLLRGSEDVEQIDADILRTFNTLEQAYMCFDSSRHGYIDKEELELMMHESHTEAVTPRRASGASRDPSFDHGSSMQPVFLQRFAELDGDHNGRISFIDFLFCLEGWVMDAEDDEDVLVTPSQA